MLGPGTTTGNYTRSLLVPGAARPTATPKSVGRGQTCFGNITARGTNSANGWESVYDGEVSKEFRVAAQSSYGTENPMNAPAPHFTDHITTDSTDSFSGWWVVWRLWSGGSGTFDYGKVPVAAFPTEAMAREWISAAPHRSRDFTEPMNTTNKIP